MCVVFLAPVLAEFSTSFGPAEYFALALFAFVATSSVVADSVLRGLASLVLGLGIAVVGIDGVTEDLWDRSILEEVYQDGPTA